MLIDHPHRYLTHYLMSLKDWLGESESSITNLSRTAWALLQDYLTHPCYIDHPGDQVALAVIKIAVKLNENIEVPCNNESELVWDEALHEEVSKEQISIINEQILSLYPNTVKRCESPQELIEEDCLNIKKI